MKLLNQMELERFNFILICPFWLSPQGSQTQSRLYWGRVKRGKRVTIAKKSCIVVRSYCCEEAIKFDMVLISQDMVNSNHWIFNFLQMTIFHVLSFCVVFMSLNKQKTLNSKWANAHKHQQYLLCCLKCKYMYTD